MANLIFSFLFSSASHLRLLFAQNVGIGRISCLLICIPVLFCSFAFKQAFTCDLNKIFDNSTKDNRMIEWYLVKFDFCLGCL